MYKKHASTLMANNIASAARLQLVIGDDPDVLTKKFGFDKYDAEDMGKVLKEGSRSGSIEGGDSKGSHHHGHHHHPRLHHPLYHSPPPRGRRHTERHPKIRTTVAAEAGGVLGCTTVESQPLCQWRNQTWFWNQTTNMVLEQT